MPLANHEQLDLGANPLHGQVGLLGRLLLAPHPVLQVFD
jgi:hypothetical protein